MRDESLSTSSTASNEQGAPALIAICLLLGMLLAMFVANNTDGSAFGGNFPAPSTSSYVTLAEQDAAQAGIPPSLFVRQMQEESGFDPNALSPAGAEGIAQFMPTIARELGIDPWHPAQALKAAATMMADYLHHYGNFAEALAAYNCGSGCLDEALARCGSAWMGCLPGETQAYIHIIENG